MGCEMRNNKLHDLGRGLNPRTTHANSIFRGETASDGTWDVKLSFGMPNSLWREFVREFETRRSRADGNEGRNLLPTISSLLGCMQLIFLKWALVYWLTANKTKEINELVSFLIFFLLFAR